MIAAITGGTGFIGSHLVARLLANGDEVRVFSRRPDVRLGKDVQLHLGDLAEGGATLDRFVQGADVLYHCAGEIRDRSRMRALHVDGTARLLKAARGRIGRWVQLSSVGAYGPRREGTVTEETPDSPIGEYEVTKAESDRMVEQAGANGDIAWCVLRPSIVFGPGASNHSLYQLITMVNRGLFCFVGSPGASANYIHVADVVHALLLCATRDKARGRYYNLSDHCSIESLIDAIALALGRRSPRLRLPAPLLRGTARALSWLPGFPLTPSRVDALCNRSTYPIERIRRELGYEHILGLRQGVTGLVENWKSRCGAR